MTLLHEDRLFPADPGTRAVARRLYAAIRDLPIVSPHGHTQAAWFAHNQPFPDPARLFVQPDHYVYRMLYSQGVSLDDLEIGAARNQRSAQGLAHLRRATIISFAEPHAHVAGLCVSGALRPDRAALGEDRRPLLRHHRGETLTPEFLPRALYERFRLEVLATTDSPLDSLSRPPGHSRLRMEGAHYSRHSAPTRSSIPSSPAFAKTIARLGEMTGEDTRTLHGYLQRARRSARALQATGLHGDRSRPSHRPHRESVARRSRDGSSTWSCPGAPNARRQELFRAQMLTEMARHERARRTGHADSSRQRRATTTGRSSSATGATWAPIFRTATDYVHALRPLLDRYGNERNFTLILFTLDESGLQPRTRAAGRALSLPAAGPSLVVPRQP